MLYLLTIILFFLFVVPAMFTCAYHLFLGMIAFFFLKNTKRNQVPQTHIAILIPAHNETDIIAKTLDSVMQLDYPAELLDIYVVADNCTDDTAEIVRSYGLKILERFNDSERGKGYALAWAVPQIISDSNCDAIFILDADCLIDSHALRSLDAVFSGDQQNAAGSRCVQLNYVVGNPDLTPVSFMLATANCLENDFFYAPMTRLGLSVLLRGTGMLSPRAVFDKFPWNAFSIVEDTEYSLTLLNNGINTVFVHDAKIYSDFPSEQKTLTTQRSRWIGGNVSFAFSQGAKFLWNGIREKNCQKMNTGLTLLFISRPLIAFQLFLTTVLALILVILGSGVISLFTAACLCCALGCWLGYIIYFSLGLYGLGLTRHRLLLLLGMPISIASYLWMSVKALLSKRTTNWVKTPR
ncbi:MAG: glycosyltransferase family 2 protein [Thermoguttaceae bacterium]